jgi:hypothetical protein
VAELTSVEPSTAQLTTAELEQATPGSLDTDALAFSGLRGDRSRHLDRTALEVGLAALPAAPRDRGTLALMVARGPNGERHLPSVAELTRTNGMPGDRWAGDDRYGPEYQLATMNVEVARLVANGQPLELHGDNLFLDLDVSVDNLPVGSRLALGSSLLEVTPQAHNGCKKWVQRFGLDAMHLNRAAGYRPRRLRGLYLRVVEDGSAHVGDAIVVVSRGPACGARARHESQPY